MTTIAYKAFNAAFTCRGFQYEVGKTYTHDGKVRMCRAGFHACENPLDVLTYYNLCDSRFAVVELSGAILTHDEEDSKLCAPTLHVRAELKFPDFVKAAVQWVIEACKSKDGESSERVTASSGAYARLASAGNGPKLASSGNGPKLASSGYGAKLASSGDGAQLASSGNGAQLASSGDWAQLASSGAYARLASSGENGVICSSGPRTRAKGKAGAWIALAEFDDDGKCVGFATGCAGKDFPADVWVCAKDGKLVEVGE